MSVKARSAVTVLWNAPITSRCVDGCDVRHCSGPTCQQRIPLLLLLKLEVTCVVLHAEPPRRARQVGDLAQKDVEIAAQTSLLNRAEGRVAMTPHSRKVGDVPTRHPA